MGLLPVPGNGVAELGTAKSPLPPPAPYSNSESVSPGQAHIWVSSLTFLADLEEAVFSI